MRRRLAFRRGGRPGTRSVVSADGFDEYDDVSLEDFLGDDVTAEELAAINRRHGGGMSTGRLTALSDAANARANDRSQDELTRLGALLSSKVLRLRADTGCSCEEAVRWISFTSEGLRLIRRWRESVRA
jgi:hypothetical protein